MTGSTLKVSKVVVGALAVVAIAAFVGIALLRFRYPFELEWLESETLQHIRRLTEGNSLYTSPTIEMTQLPYAPLSFGLGALLAEVFGMHFWVMRAVSIVATLATLAVLSMLVVRETGSRFGAVIAAGVYAASFRVTGTFFDVAKSDALFIFLSIAAIFFARDTKRLRNAVIAGGLMGLAILTKQTAIFFLIPVALFLLATKWRFGAMFGGVAVSLAGVTSLVLHLVTNGWYTFFVWELLFGHDVVEANKVHFFTRDMLPYLPTVGIVVLASFLWAKREQWWVTGFYAVSASGLFAGAYTGRLHSGGYDNVLMPAALACAMLAGLAAAYATSRKARPLISATAIALCALQLFSLRYDVSSQLPTTADRRAGEQTLQLLRDIPGEIWVPRHPEYVSMAGKGSFAGQGGIEDVLRGRGDDAAKNALTSSIAEAIRTQRFAAIVLDEPSDAAGFPQDWLEYYERTEDLRLPDSTFHPVVNDTGRPTTVYLRK